MSNFNVGDKVRVTGDSNYNEFPIGTLAEVVKPASTPSGKILVTTNPAVRTWREAYNAAPVCRYVMPSELELVTEDAEAEPEPSTDPEILLDLARVQALHAARELLGVEDWLIEDVLAAASFILGEAPSVTLEEFTAPADAGETVDVGDELEITDADGDIFTVEKATSDRKGDLAFVSVNEESGAYLTAADIDRVIAYLTALKA